jgi:hypothetical protein
MEETIQSVQITHSMKKLKKVTDNMTGFSTVKFFLS